MAIPGRKPSKQRLEASALYREIGQRCYLPEETVRTIIETFAEVTKEALQNNLKVVVRCFGTFEGKAGLTRFKIKFKASNDYKTAIKEKVMPMEKYGVELKNEAILMAQITGECPDCKSKLESTNPPKCPNCGTKPFEAKEAK